MVATSGRRSSSRTRRPSTRSCRNGPDLDAGLPREPLRHAFAEVRALIGAVPQPAEVGNPIAGRMPTAGLREVTANLDGCYGCGNCNLGCAFSRKLSMLSRVLPDTQRDTDERRRQLPGFRGRLDLLPGCEVAAVSHQGARATGVRCRLHLADGATRRLEIDADEVIVAAGAIHSSRTRSRPGLTR